MKWEGREESENVEDRRMLGKKAGLALGGAGTLIAIVLALAFGVDPQQVAKFIGAGAAPQGQGQANAPAPDPQEEKLAAFSKVIFHDTEVVWDEQFRLMGLEYPKPILVLFRDQ